MTNSFSPQQFLTIERTICLKQNYKSKLNKISLMIEESCFRAKSSPPPNNNQKNNQNNGNQMNTKNQKSTTVSSQKATNQKTTTKTNKTDKKTATNTTTAATNKKVESRDWFSREKAIVNWAAFWLKSQNSRLETFFVPTMTSFQSITFIVIMRRINCLQHETPTEEHSTSPDDLHHLIW